MLSSQNSSRLIYLDYNATTPIAKEVQDVMIPFITDHFGKNPFPLLPTFENILIMFFKGNPSSSHFYGKTTKAAVEKARSQVAALLGCEVDEVLFTSGGTESNNYAIKVN
jgi:cysteine desulfurase